MKETKRLFIDIETGKAPDANLFEPKYKEPRLKKDGTPYADSKTIDEQRAEWESECALSPLTGQVLLICFDNGNDFWAMQEDGFKERDVLSYTVDCLSEHDLIIGHYIKDFDLPFIINRCRKHGITPPDLMNKVHGKWYWKEHIIDLRDLWTLGKYNEHISLNNMAKYFGLPVKDETTGKNFEQVFNEDINNAIEYCKHDVELTKQIYEKLK
jgi:predicted PolB exonuclease-like 3'-5' exonuclease